MALTVTQSPDSFSSAYRPIEWRLDSDTTDIVNLLANVLIDGTAIDHLYTFPTWIDTASGFRTDFQQIARDVLDFRNFTVSGTSIINSTQSVKIMRVEFFEEYTVSGTLVNNYPTPDKTENVRILPIILQHDENQEVSTYINDDTVSGTGLWLTHGSYERVTRVGETEVLSILVGEGVSGVDVRARYEFYKNGSSTGSDIVRSFPSTSPGIYHVPVGYSALASTLESNGADRYRVSFEAEGARRSEYVYYDIETSCSHRRFHFINSLGGWESITMTGHEEKSNEISRTMSEKILPVGFDKTDYGRFLKGSMSDVSFTTFTGQLSQSDIDWIFEIYESPRVFVEENGVLLPVIILNEETNLKTLARRINQLPIEWTYSNRRITHES